MRPWLVLGLLALSACERGGADVSASRVTEPSASNAAAPAAVAPPADERAEPPPRAHLETHAGTGEIVTGSGSAGPSGCRVMSLTGSVKWDSGTPVEARAWLEAERWMELATGARLHLKHAASGREWTIAGPGRVLACPDGEEEIVIAGGTVETELGSGVRPGAEVLIGTPFGTLRYADARAKLLVTARELSLSLSAGEAWLSSSSGADLRVSGPRPTRRGSVHKLSPARALSVCQQAAQDAELKTTALLAPGAEPLGSRARDQIRARQRANTVCASSLAAVLQQEQGERLSQRLDELRGYRAQSRRLPPRSG